MSAQNNNDTRVSADQSTIVEGKTPKQYSEKTLGQQNDSTTFTGRRDTLDKKDKSNKPSFHIEASDHEDFLKAAGEGIKPAFMAKVHVLNEAIKEIGMGRFQYELFITAGFGWFADNICERSRTSMT